MAELRYAPSAASVALLAAAGLGGAVLAARTEPAGRLLLGITAAVLIGEALRSVLLRPALRADDTGIEVVRGLRRVRYPWSSVDAVGVLGGGRVANRPRRGAKALELDVGTTVVVVPAYRLGRPLPDVVSELAARRAAAGS